MSIIITVSPISTIAEILINQFLIFLHSATLRSKWKIQKKATRRLLSILLFQAFRCFIYGIFKA